VKWSWPHVNRRTFPRAHAHRLFFDGDGGPPGNHTYAGGLGVLAGDTARSCADLELPVVFVTLLSRAGYFRQQIAPDGRQIEQPDWWAPERWCAPLNAMVAVEIEQKPVWIRPWLYIHTCPHGHKIPILLLDTQLG
jgi:starch phosphorylase